MNTSSDDVDRPGTTTEVPDSQPELDRLRAQVADLESQLVAVRAATPPPPAPEPSTRRSAGDVWRGILVGVLIFLAAVIAPLSVVATWAHDEVSDTNRYVQTVTPLASDPAVQNAIANRISTEIFNRVDITAVTQQAVKALESRGLPPNAVTTLNALTVPAANGIRGFVTDQVHRIVRSPQFADLWVTVNRAAHAQMVAVLTGKSGTAVQINGNTVQLNVGVLINRVKHQLEGRGFGLASKIPAVNAKFTLFQSADIGKVQAGFNFLNTAARVLPILGLVLIGAAVAVARSHRKALLAAALAVAASMILLGLGLNIFRTVYLNALPATASQPAAGVIYDTLVGFIRLSLRAILVVALAVALGAWLAGSSQAAVATRRGITRGSAALRHSGERAGMDTGRFGEWVYRYRTALRGATIGIAVLVYVLAAHPTGAWTLGVVVVAGVVLLVIELLGKPPAPGENTTPTVAEESAEAGETASEDTGHDGEPEAAIPRQTR
jgi:hypothetical protein